MDFTGLNQGVSRSVFPLEAPGENLFPCLFHLLLAACISWFVTPSSIFKAGNRITQTSASTVFTSLLLTPASFFSFKDTCNYTDPIWIVHDALPISKSLS